MKTQRLLALMLGSLAALANPCWATTITFDGAQPASNNDIPLNYGSFMSGNATGFVTTDGTGATPKIGLTWNGNRPNEWEYHAGTTWVHETPTNVAQMDHNRGGDFDDVAEIIFSPIDGRSVKFNSFLLSGATDMGAAATFDWAVVGTGVGGTLNIGVGANTGAVPVAFTGTPGTEYTLRFTHRAGLGDNNIGVALDDLSFSEVLLPGAEVLRLFVNRVTGAITMQNVGASPAVIKGYAITSEAGALDQDNWRSIAGNYDSAGNGSVDPNDDWSPLSQPTTATDFSEYEFGGDGATIAAGSSIVLSQPGGGAWLKSPTEDLEMEVVMADGRTNRYTVEYVNGPASGYLYADLNFDGTINALDWPIYNAGRGVDMTSFSLVQAYQAGDLDGDLDNDIADFLLFKDFFVSANGLGSFEAIFSIPEPSAGLLSLLGVTCLACRRTRRHAAAVSRVASVALAIVAGLMVGSNARATTLTFDDAPAGSNGDLPEFYGSNVTGDSLGYVTTDGTGATPNIALRWAPTGGDPTSDVLEFHRGGAFSGAGFSVPVLQFDVDTSGQPGPPDNPTVDFTVTNDFSLKLNSFDIGNATDQTTAPYRWIVDLIRLSDFEIVATQTTSFLGAGSRETVTFNYTGDPNESYRLRFDDEGANQVRTAIDNFSFSQVLVQPPRLTLQVNTLNGAVTLLNDSGVGFDIDSYEITSESGSLDVAGWNSLQSQDFEGNGAPGTGNGWEQAGGVGPGQLIESYLLGSTALADGMSPISLGTLFDHDKVGAMQDLRFTYHEAGTGPILRTGLVEYVQLQLDGDYNNDGLVNAADYTVWRDTQGQTGSGLAADGSGNGTVGPEDYTYWRVRYGNTASSTSQSLAVPEPTAGLTAVVLLCGSLSVRTRRLTPAVTRSATLLGVAWVAASATQASAATTVDRLYLFGDSASEPASANGLIGSQTLDSQFVNGSDTQNLTRVGNPRYVNVGPSGLARPGAASGRLGAQFDGDGDALWGAPLNRPDETAGTQFIGNGPLLFPYPVNYDNITARGLQLWVYPDADALGAGRQGVVMDTIAAGGIAITADGKWTQSNDSIVSDGFIEAKAPVVGNQWHHVMHHIYRSLEDEGPKVLPGGIRGDLNFTSVVYINGIAVSANNGTPTPGELDNGTRIGALVVGAEEAETVDFVTPGFTNHFKGKIDDLQMYVFGDNRPVSNGADFGTFNLLEDNAWIAGQIAAIPGGTLIEGDINRDGVLNGNDINALGLGWLKEKRLKGSVNTLTVGDWQTYGWGDLNLDGKVDLADAIRLDNALQSIGGPALSFSRLIAGQIPEPATAALVLLGLVPGAMRRRSLSR